MNDLFLRFVDEDEMHNVLCDIGFAVRHDDYVEVLPGSYQYAIAVVGRLSGYGGVHVNVRVIDPALDISILEPYRVYPNSPSCVWA